MATDDAASERCRCPDADYGIEIVQNGARLRFAPPVVDADCGAGPLRGHAREACGLISLETAACAKMGGGVPCLEISRYQEVKYVDADGTVFLGSMLGVSVEESGTFPDPLNLLVGIYSAELFADGGGMSIGGRFVLCGNLVKLPIPC